MFGNKKKEKQMQEIDKLKELKSFTWQSVLTSLLFIIIGAILVIEKDAFVKKACFTIGGILILIGIVFIVIYAVSDVKKTMNNNKLTVGIALVIAGLVVIIGYSLVKLVVPIVLGVLIIINGFSKLQVAINSRKMDKEKSKVVLIVAILNILLGVFAICCTWMIVKFIFVIIGLILIFSGITDIINVFYMGKQIKNYIKDQEALIQDPKD